MGDLSLNPSTWSLSNVAEFAAETITGSEFAGDVAGAVVGFASGDVMGGVDQLMDGGENVVGFATDPRTQAAAGDAFGTGSAADPAQCTPPSGGTAAEGAQGGSLEDRIFALLLKLMEKAEKTLEKEVGATEAQGTDAGEGQLAKMQRANDKVKQLSQLITGMLSAFNESAMATIRSIR